MNRTCPECAATFTISDDAMQGEVVECADCGQSYEIDENLNLKTAESVSEDWGQ